MNELLNEKSLRALLNLDAEQAIDCIQIFDEIDSTNTEALRQIRAGNTLSRVIYSRSQTAGKGRRGREWLSPANAGIYFSLTQSFQASADSLQGLSLVTAISVLEALAEFGASALKLKWPNDVLSENKKLAGILLELQAKDGRLYIVFGVGVNRQLPSEAIASIDRPVTDLSRLLGDLPAENELLASLLNCLCTNLGSYAREGFAPFTKRWNSLDRYRMSEIVIQNGEKQVRGRSLGVDATGALLLETTDGLQSINGGEVFPSLRPLSDEALQS